MKTILGNTTVFLFGVITFSCLGIGCTENKAEISQEHVFDAREFVSQNRLEDAVNEYLAAIADNPGNQAAYFELAAVHADLKETDLALKYYKQAEKLDEKGLAVKLRIAQLYLQSNQLQDAREYLSKAMALSDRSIEAYHLLSRLQIKEKEYESAIVTLKKALALDPSNSGLLLSLAGLYEETGQTENAKLIYQETIQHDSASRQAYMGLARLYAAEKNWGAVETLLKGVIKTPGLKSKKYADLAAFYDSQQKDDLAEEYFIKATTVSENDLSAYTALAEFYADKGLKNQAVNTLIKALKEQGKDSVIFVALSQVYFHFNEIKAAQRMVNQALETDPSNIDAMMQKGKILVVNQDYKTALEYFDRILRLDDQDADTYYYKALCIKHQGVPVGYEQRIFSAAAGMLNNPEAFKQKQIQENLQAAVSIDPSFVDARILLAEAYIMEKNSVKARQQIEEVLNQTSSNPRIMTLLAAVNLLENKVDRAEKIMLDIVVDHPDDIESLERLGLIYKMTERLDEALLIFKRILKKDPDYLELMKSAVAIYLSNGRQQEALDFVSQASQSAGQENAPFLNYLKGKIYLDSNQLEMAGKVFRKAFEIKPEFVPPRLSFAKLIARQGKIEAAEKEFFKILEIDPQNECALIAIAALYDMQQETEKAVQYYRKVLKINPQHAEANNNLAFILSKSPEKLDEARRLAQKAVEQEPRNPDILDTMGWIYYLKGDYLNALSDLKKSLDIRPDSALTSYHYGMALRKNREHDKSREYLQQAVNLDPDFKGMLPAEEE